MTQTNPFATLARMTNVARFFAALAENTPYTVTTDTGRTRVFPTRTSARRFAEVVATSTGGEAEVWANGRPLALIADHIGWCVPVTV
jgi:hypothetical protein